MTVGRIRRHQRALVLLAGLLGVLVGTPAAAAAGSGAAELVRAGAAVAASSVGDQAAPSAARPYRSNPTGRPLRTAAAHAFAAVLADVPAPTAQARRTGVTPDRAAHPAGTAASPRQVRGPPSITGS